jgi:cytoskeletal protein RodZ
MAPLDTGSVTHVIRQADPFGRGPGPSPDEFNSLGEYLRAVREHRNVSLQQVSDLTRVRKLYLAGLESNDLSLLPSRPFAVGYVRAYARVLGLDGEELASRFRTQFPDVDTALKAPIGVAHEDKHRRRVGYWAAGALVTAVVLWNVAQRTMINDQPAQAPLATQAEPPLADPFSVVKLSAPTPPPADQTVPQPYVTPGLPQITQVGDATAATPAAAPAPIAGPAVFTSHAAIYGATPQGVSQVIIQAKKRASLIVRGPDGSVYFARELAAGEAYSAPINHRATADVSDPDAFDAYLGGRLLGPLTEPQTPLDKLAPAAAPVQMASPQFASPKPAGTGPA